MERIKNIAYKCLSEPCEQGFHNSPAFTWLYNDLSSEDFTYQKINSMSDKIANVLKDLRVEKKDCVSIFLPKSPELVFSFFAILKNEAVSCVLFSTFGEHALFDRLSDSRTKILITKNSLLKKLNKIKGKLPDLNAVLVTDIEEHQDETTLSLPKLIGDAKETFKFSAEIDSEAPAFIQYTSGSTGKPKGALHVHSGYVSMENSFREVFDLKEDEIFWCTADPAWITGLVYGLIAPMITHAVQIHFGGNYEAQKWLKILEEYQVNVWYTAPTALRMMMQEDRKLFGEYDFSRIDRIYSVGEPLNPEVYHWGKKIFGTEIYDNWFQSETGSIMITNKPGMQVKPGSMGKPLSYIDAYILDDKMNPIETGSQGNLCLKKGWASMFRTYLNKEELYLEKFQKKDYISGDLAYQDKDGYFWYVSRADDVINTAGHLVGPFEVESALLEVNEVVDVAVIGAPDAILHEKIVAFLCLPEGTKWSRALELKCRVKVSNNVSTIAIPAEYHVVDLIPKNTSGKILRRVLKAWYQGKDPGDLSTMEEK